MVTILAILELGYESTFEHLAFRQLRGAYHCGLVCVGHDVETFEEGLDSVTGTLVYMVPPGRVESSTEFADFVLPDGDVVFCFGSPQDSMVKHVGEDVALHITTPGDADMMAVTVAGIVMERHGVH